MANTYVDFTATAAQTDFPFSFPYLEGSHVVVEIDGVTKTLTTDYTVVTSPAVKVVLTSGATAGQKVRVKRDSNADSSNPLVDFVNGSVLTESSLDRSYLHNLYLNEEIGELNQLSLQKEVAGAEWDAKGLRIINVADPTAAQDAGTKNYIDTEISKTVTGSTTEPTKYTFTGDGSTSFTFSPGITLDSDNMYEVAIDGVLQEPTVAYGINATSNTITFTSTPPTSSNIVVILRGYAVPLTTNPVTTGLIDDDAITSAKISDTDSVFLVDDTSAQKKVVINEGGVDVDFKVEGNSDANLINTDGNASVGMGKTATAGYKLSVDGDVSVSDTNGDNFGAIVINGTEGAAVQLKHDSASGQTFNLSSNPPTGGGDGSFGIGSINTTTHPTLSVTNVSTTSTRATLTTSTSHNCQVGESVTISGSSEATWNAGYLITGVPSATQIEIAKPGGSVPSAPFSAVRNETFTTMSIRRIVNASELFAVIKMHNLPTASTEPAWLEAGQLWIDSDDQTIKIKQYFA